MNINEVRIGLLTVSDINENIDVFGLLRVTGGNAKRTKMTPSAGQWKRGRERGTEDREKGVGSKIFPAQTITQGRVRGQEYSCLNYLTPSYTSPPPPLHLPRARGGGEGSASS